MFTPDPHILGHNPNFAIIKKQNASTLHLKVLVRLMDRVMKNRLNFIRGLGDKRFEESFVFCFSTRTY